MALSRFICIPLICYKSNCFHIPGFLHIFHFKIPYFSRLRFPNLSIDFQTIFNRHWFHNSIRYHDYIKFICAIHGNDLNQIPYFSKPHRNLIHNVMLSWRTCYLLCKQGFVLRSCFSIHIKQHLLHAQVTLE